MLHGHAAHIACVGRIWISVRIHAFHSPSSDLEYIICNPIAVCYVRLLLPPHARWCPPTHNCRLHCTWVRGYTNTPTDVKASKAREGQRAMMGKCEDSRAMMGECAEQLVISELSSQIVFRMQTRRWLDGMQLESLCFPVQYKNGVC